MRAGGQARGTCLLGVLGPGVCGRIPGRPYDRRRDCGAVPLATSDCGAPCTHGSQCQGEWHQLYHQRVRVPCGATYSYHLGYYLLLLATNIVWFRQMLWVRVGVGVWGGCRRPRCGRARARGRGRVRALVGVRQPTRMAAKWLASRMSAMV